MAAPAPIPQCNPMAGYLEHAREIDAALQRVLTGGRYILGPEVAAFEAEFAAFISAGHAIGVANGTDAIELALRAAGVGPGDGVLTVSLSAVATTAAIRAVGAVPLFVDVTPGHGLIDPQQVRHVLALAGGGHTSIPVDRIKALVPVHLYGACCDMDALEAIAREHGLALIEDCAQAHGARWKGRAAGTFGAAASFSFYPTKNLGAIGDGGAITTNDAAFAERVRLLRQYGWRERYVSDIEGGNSRLDELQAALLRVKLGALDRDNAARRALAEVYIAGIRHPGVVVPTAIPGAEHAYHQFVVRTAHRDALQAHLARQGISTLVHYPRAIHQQPAYADPAYHPQPLPETERWAAEVLSLPMFPQLEREDAMRVVAAIDAWDGRA